MPATEGDAAGVGDARFRAAHAAIDADTGIQHSLPPIAPDPPIPEWVKAVHRALDAVGRAIGRAIAWLFHWLPPLPWPQILLWGLLALLAVFALWVLIDRARSGVWRMPAWRRRAMSAEAAEIAADDWAPQAAPARALLKEADRLAAEGRFAEAVHLLLRRSVEDIGRRRPGLLRPALTSREIAGLPAVPGAARSFFATIAGAVERSLFGGRPVDRPDWEACRRAYADFALAKAWAA